MNRLVTATEARKNFFQLIKIAGKPGSNVTITLEGEVPVVMMSADEFEGWMETLEIMSDPQLVQDIKEGMEDVKAGRVIPWETVKKQSKRR